MILVFGSINIDLVARVDSIARPGETVLSRRADTFFGGKGANQAVAAARIGAGGYMPVALVGAVGDDAFGQSCLDNLRANDVDTSHIRIVEDPTGCAFIAVARSGENAITVASGANMSVRANDVSDELLDAAAIVVLQMEVPLVESVAVAARARQRGAKVLWNVAPASSALSHADVTAILGSTDILVANEHEALAIGSVAGKRMPSNEADAARDLSHSYGCLFIVTAGKRGAFAFHPAGGRLDIAAPAIEPVDTTGAGDTFVGVLAYSLATGMSLEASLDYACRAASHSCLIAGAQAGMPRPADLP